MLQIFGARAAVDRVLPLSGAPALSGTLVRYLKIFSLPLITYVSFFGFLVFGKPPSSDLTGMHAVMGAVFLAFGCSICYFMSILPNWAPFDSPPRLMSRFWPFSTVLFYLLLADASLRIHENLGPYLGGESFVFIIYGGALLILVGVYRESFGRPFWLFLLGFIVVSGIAVVGDSLGGHEGLIMVGGKLLSYEQFCETFSVFLLSSGFASEAIQDLIVPFKSR